jgi:hypothetical protein
MKQIKAYKTIDGKIFLKVQEAINHENILIAIKEIIDSFGGIDKEVNSTYEEFLNGKGFIRIKRDTYEKTLCKINNLKEFLGYEAYDIKNIRCFEDEYLGKISSIMYCLLEDELTNDFLRYGSSYFVKNIKEAIHFELKIV